MSRPNVHLAFLLGCILTLGFLVTPGLTAEPVTKKIVLLAGRKSHGPGAHEYVQDLQFLQYCLENATNVKGIKTELHLEGWPEDPATLDDADTIVLFSDGSDHDEKSHPFLVDDRMKVIEKQMKRGCGLMVQHYATFCPERCREQYLDWVGGYFDYQNGPAANKWFSKIGWATSILEPATPKHPVLNGVGPFEHQEEYYYNIRFRENDPRLTPISTVKIPGEKDPQVVSWAIERKDGGRGFATTCGHTHTDLVNKADYRKLHLNGICWTAGIDVPAEGVQTLLPGEKKMTDDEKPIRALIITGQHHPGHPWQPSTTAIKQILKCDPRFNVDTIIDPDLMAKTDLKAYDVLILNYCNWNLPSLSDAAGEALKKYIADGGGFAILHFANGAWGPGANPPVPDFDVWDEYCGKICRRIWIDGKSSHDVYGKFRVKIIDQKHPITQGMKDFDTYDELYFDQQGEEPIETLATAHSKAAQKDAPMFFTYTYGKGRCFQNMLGHSIESITNPGAAALTLRGCAWAAGRTPAEETLLIPFSIDQRDDKNFVGFVDTTQKAATVTPADPSLFLTTPMTVECFVKLATSAPFNVIVSNDPKSSPTHWELYSNAGDGSLVFYAPGCTPSFVQTGVCIADNSWHYIAATYNGNKMELFVDGEKVASADMQSPPANVTRIAGPLAIGKAYDNDQAVPCNGQIDELRISNTVREIGAAPQKPFEADAQTIGLWHFDENPGAPILNDASDKKNDARF